MGLENQVQLAAGARVRNCCLGWDRAGRSAWMQRQSGAARGDAGRLQRGVALLAIGARTGGAALERKWWWGSASVAFVEAAVVARGRPAAGKRGAARVGARRPELAAGLGWMLWAAARVKLD